VPHLPPGYLCQGCDQGFPAWEQLLLGVVGIAIAFGLITAVTQLAGFRSRRRDARLRACFLGVQRAWGVLDAGRLGPFVTPALAEQLARQLADIAAGGRVVHHEDPRVDALRVVRGGGRRDSECVARIESSVRHWLTDESGAIREGSEAPSHRDVLWRFSRGPRGEWVAAEIGVSL
jgi:predicted lipid-binding transport protein (Tim44 family)